MNSATSPKLTPVERERVNKLCQVMLAERRIWSRRFYAWMNMAVAARSAARMDRALEHDARIDSVRDELLDYLRRLLPEREVGGEELGILIDLYANTHGYRWDGEPANDGERT